MRAGAGVDGEGAGAASQQLRARWVPSWGKASGVHSVITHIPRLPAGCCRLRLLGRPGHAHGAPQELVQGSDGRIVRCAPLRPGGRRPRGRLRAAPRALSACYRRGLVHRNVQRENVLVAFRVDREKPAYVLCDFAFFPAAARARGAPRLLWRDEGLRRARSIARAVRTPSDMFSAGCLFFAVVTRDLPFGASRAADAGGGRTGTVGGRSGGCCSHSCTVAFTPAVTHACIFPLTPAVASRCCPQVSIDPLAQAR